VVRTRRPFFRSRPGGLLLGATLVLVAFAGILPYLPGAGLFGFVPLPGSLLGMLAAITVLYVVAAEALKRRLAP
jgi:Mg2+-importing ATPase